MPNAHVFVGYSSQPSQLADTMRNAASRITRVDGVQLTSWEGLRISGELLLPTIEESIRASTVSIFDVTQLNENVLFELGLALGADKVI
jgi:hypothetical protein